MSLPKFSNQIQQEVAQGVLLVTSKHMNRSALGIVHAVTLIYKEANFNELKTILPDSINPFSTNRTKNLFRPFDNSRPYGVIQPGSIVAEAKSKGVNMVHFTESNEIFKSADGVDVYVSNIWESEDGESGLKDIHELEKAVASWGVQLNKPIPSDAICICSGEYTIHILNKPLYDKLQTLASKQRRAKIIWIAILMVTVLSIGVLLFNH